VAFSETKCAARNFTHMMLAISWQWVTEVTLVLCLFGAACIALAVLAGGSKEAAAPRIAEQKVYDTDSIAARRERSHPFD
jgi:hypothetical protein